eukprot:1149129-Pelagomonas_calceolata.AAC.2
MPQLFFAGSSVQNTLAPGILAACSSCNRSRRPWWLSETCMSIASLLNRSATMLCSRSTWCSEMLDCERANRQMNGKRAIKPVDRDACGNECRWTEMLNGGRAKRE